MSSQYEHSNEFGFAERYGPPPSLDLSPSFNEGADILQCDQDTDDELFPVPGALADTTRDINRVDFLRRRPALPVRSRTRKAKRQPERRGTVGAFGGADTSEEGWCEVIGDDAAGKENASPRKRKLEIEIGGGKVYDLSPSKRARGKGERSAGIPAKRPFRQVCFSRVFCAMFWLNDYTRFEMLA